MFSIQPHTITDKRFKIITPHGSKIYVDYDDVNHKAVDVEIGAIVETLNQHYSLAEVNQRIDALPTEF